MHNQERPTAFEQTPQLEALITEQRSLLQALGQELRSLQQQVCTLQTEVRQQPTLGFSNGRDYIIIERDKNILWHRFDNDEPLPIKSKILKGYIRRVAFVDKEYPKLHVFIEGDREYVLVTGFETYFARELLAAIGTLKSEDLAHPVIIKPDTGSDDSKSKHKPVFCNVIHRGRTIKPGTLRDQDIHQLLKRAEAVLKGDIATVKQGHPATSQGNVTQFPASQPSAVLPKLPQMPSKAVKPAQPAATQAQNPVDWIKVCRDLNISKQQLMAVARSLKLPHGKLDRAQSARLYQAVYEQYGEAAG
ncbi:hypothetical protein C1752_04344 [Acaryochloris thomasi RCC1774]|uniref:Uncharacterized protein n=1 Tax=Acaryochloris thomasi RCC1774 TaxID=1764569 RepID=A0A2W1JP33_9CYAN|nr:hypothetical protein [Acaryochloris thomasi]PZD71914.1 hypothetical protein C1752_04344 [Acaryochloris thomasi RCC1774]